MTCLRRRQCAGMNCTDVTQVSVIINTFYLFLHYLHVRLQSTQRNGLKYFEVTLSKRRSTMPRLRVTSLRRFASNLVCLSDVTGQGNITEPTLYVHGTEKGEHEL